MSGRAHTLFEQTNTFRDALRRLGFTAESYDLPGTAADHGVDLLEAIEDAAAGKPSILDGIGRGDWVFAFFPCTYFSMGGLVNWAMTGKVKRNGRGKLIPKAYIEERARKRRHYLARFVELLDLAEVRGWRLVVENPLSSLKRSGLDPLPRCSFRIVDRAAWGDVYSKPTAFWVRNVQMPVFLPPVDCVARKNSFALRAHIRQENGGRNGPVFDVVRVKPTAGMGNHSAERLLAITPHRGGLTNGGMERVVRVDWRAKWHQTGCFGGTKGGAIEKCGLDFLEDLRAKAAGIKDTDTRRMLVRSYIHPRFADTFCAWITGVDRGHGVARMGG